MAAEGIPLDLDPLLKAAEALLKSLTYDESGIDGRGGNGGLISRETIQKGDFLRIELSRVNRLLGRKEMS